MQEQKKTGVELIAIERQRQIEIKGYTAKHDATYDNFELARAAACYAMPPYRIVVPIDWPFDPCWWNPTPENIIRQLAKAGALIAAQIDNLQNKE